MIFLKEAKGKKSSSQVPCELVPQSGFPRKRLLVRRTRTHALRLVAPRQRASHVHILSPTPGSRGTSKSGDGSMCYDQDKTGGNTDYE